MQASSIEEYQKMDEHSQPDDFVHLYSQLPHVVVVEGDAPEFAVAVRWCWTNFGPQHGECFNIEYPSCPLVLETEYLELREVYGKQWKIKAYLPVVGHCHIGNWAWYFLGKTEYDHGFGEFCFAHEPHRDAFVRQLPNIDWGENYPWSKG